MSGFVRAVAVVERSLLGGRPSSGDLRDHRGLPAAISGLADAGLPCAPGCPVPARRVPVASCQ
jgi:hypothetical protein